MKDRTSVNSEGQLVIEIPVVEDADKKYAGSYIIDRPKFKYRDIALKLMKASNGINPDDWKEAVKEVAEKRKISVSEVMKLLKNGKLTKDEEDVINNHKIAGGMDIEALYAPGSEALLRLIISSPVPIKTIDDIENLPMSVGNTLYQHALQWIINGFSVSEEREKK